MKSKITTITLSALLISVFYSIPSAEARGYSRVAYASPSPTVRVQAATPVSPPATTSVRAPSTPAKITSTSNMQAIAARAVSQGQAITRSGEAMNTASYGRAIGCSNCNNIQSKIVMPLPSNSSFAFVINPAVQPPAKPPTNTTTPKSTNTAPATRTTTSPATRTTAPTIIFRVSTPVLPLSPVNNPNLPVFSGSTNTSTSNPGNRVITPPNNNNNLGGTTSTIPSVVNNNSNPLPQNTNNQPTQNNSSNALTTPNNSSGNSIPNSTPSSTATNSSGQTSKFKVS